MNSKGTLIYIPTGLNSPELEVLLAKAQIEIKKNSTTILICSGGTGYACSKNIYSSKNLCILCKKKLKKGLDLLEGEFDVIETPSKINSDLNPDNRFLNKRYIKDYFFKKCDNGLAALSSYVNLTRDGDLEGSLSGAVLKNLIITSNTLTNFFIELINSNKFNYYVLFNGRLNQYRPLLRLLKKKNVSNLEISGSSIKEVNYQIFDFKDKFSNEINNLYKKINSHYLSNKYKDFSKTHFEKRLRGEISLDVKAHTKNQKLGLLPNNWDSSKKNIVYFTSSNDEIHTLGKEYFLHFYKNQNEAVKKISLSISKLSHLNICLWIRMHPNLSYLRWDFVKFQKNLNKKYKNIFVIKPESKISSYSLMFNSDIVIGTASSSAIVESVYWKKPSIIIGNSVYAKLKMVHCPKTHNGLVNLLKKDKIKIFSNNSSKKIVNFWLSGGYKYRNLTGNLKQGFFFKNKKIDFSTIDKIKYYKIKICEKFVNSSLAKYKFIKLLRLL